MDIPIGEGPGSLEAFTPLFWVKKRKEKEGRKSGRSRASKNKPVWIRHCPLQARLNSMLKK